jgi:hypothetical protein
MQFLPQGYQKTRASDPDPGPEGDKRAKLKAKRQIIMHISISRIISVKIFKSYNISIKN